MGGGPGASIALKARGLAGAVEWPFAGYALMGSGLEVFPGVRGAWVGARVGSLLARIFCAGPGGCAKAVGALRFVWATQVEDCGEQFPVFLYMFEFEFIVSMWRFGWGSFAGRGAAGATCGRSWRIYPLLPPR